MTTMPTPKNDHIIIVRGTVTDVSVILHLLDKAVEWLVSQDRVGQWGTTPFSEKSRNHERVTEFATSGLGVWLAIKVLDDTAMKTVDEDPEQPSTALYFSTDLGVQGIVVGALAVGDKTPYVPAVSEPEAYVKLLVTDRKYIGGGIGRRLLDHARALTREAGVSLMRVDCYGGGDGKLVKYYESQGFKRSVTMDVEGWPCQVLEMRLEGS
ncbi:hypothetical protein EYZ11_003485 [Aspergillus tanneri]|uniref:N-acetyltransferase domain-containing protein n=1 Tax=Aspergillus tanneri TaxID=1220188 RepID=A0A4S3JN83_9EURO|nr:uncharacterized protein ATNIH1004_007049 [Aspergillus tanneri]KAA8645630.1 hypothetical protein ATNIH1004_007049 [Aspergillus tanneri]THC97042.1 hypothetical protein EYZ11_003485 [Aspergillus tanneri]